MAILRFAAVVLLIAVAACQREPTFIEFDDRQVSIHALLVGGEDSTRVLITRASAGNSGGDAIGVTNAQVRLTRSDQEIVLSAGGSCIADFPSAVPIGNAGCYTGSVPGGIAHGATYDIEIRIPGLEVIRGSTTVPSVPVILAPAPNSVLTFPSTPQNVQPFGVAWNVADANERATIHLETDQTTCRVGFVTSESLGLERWLSVRGSGDTTAVIGFWNCVEAPLPQSPGRLVVTAYDDNYDIYARTIDDAVPASEASAGITGAFGVFASAARVAVPVELRRQ